MLEQELKTAIALSRQASDAILEVYKTDFKTLQKIGADNFSEPVTAADKTASRIIVDGLHKAFPDDGILSEEEVDDLDHRLSRERIWIIDPLDGTAGFIKRDGDFCVQIGLAIRGVATLGVVFMPVHATLNYAVKGEGAWAVYGDGEPERLHSSDKTDLSEMCLAMSRDHPSPRMGRISQALGITKTERRGSVGLKVALIASQTCDLYIHPSPRTKLWDTCAPQIILEEAGGRFTDLFGQPMRYDRPELQNQNGIVATNGAGHDIVIDGLRPILAEFGRLPYEYAA
jgi:3'(2'), 5'-bisphosphate nucleotidase